MRFFLKKLSKDTEKLKDLHISCFLYPCIVDVRILDARVAGGKNSERYSLGESYVTLMLLLCSSYSGRVLKIGSRRDFQRQCNSCEGA